MQQIAAGDRGAVDRLFPLVCAELHEIAARSLAREPNAKTLQPTLLVDEAFLRLIGADDAKISGRSHFLALAARAMRQVLVDHARARAAAKRGALPESVSIAAEIAGGVDPVDVLAVHDALVALEERSAEQARIVELRVFGGLELEEIAAILGTSRATVERRLVVARAFLNSRLSD